MKASVAGRVRHTHLPKSKALLPLFEAVVNSFQAIEDAGGADHRITITGHREDTLDPEQPGRIESFTVTDTGIGFNDANYDSFDTVDSPYKAGRGGKGLGRFLWLKAFERVDIDSHYWRLGGGGLSRRTFTFVAADTDQECQPQPSNQTTPLTTVKLSGYRQPYRDECPATMEAIAERLIVHFLPLFLNPHGPALTLTDQNSPAIDLRIYFRDNFQAFATQHAFTAAGESFTLSGFRLQGALAEHHELVYGANFREVITERLSRYVPNLRSKLAHPERGPFTYLGFIQGPLLDEKVNSERTDFSIPHEPSVSHSQSADQDDSNSDLFAHEISLKAIRDEALKAVTEDLKPFLDQINTNKEAALETYISETSPQYRVLMKYKAEFIDQIPPMATKPQMEMALHRQLYERQIKLKQEGSRLLNEVVQPQDQVEFYARFDRFVSDENEIGKTALAQYVVHRRLIVGLLEKALSLDAETGQYALEKTVHSLVFPMRTLSDDVPFEQQNLWIIDERLTFHSFLSSDLPLNSIPAWQGSSDSRPDVFVLDIFNQPLVFSEDTQPLGAMVVIEFKKPDRSNYRDEDPVTQVYRMIREIRAGKVKDKSGRYIQPANELIPAYCYILCDLAPQVRVRFENMGARSTPDNMGYYGFNEKLNAYYEVISYQKLLADAKKRNRILFEKLNLPTEH
jgi:hypothetical protein